jgi:hypothetical protein
MIGQINTTNPVYIKHLNCNPETYKRVVFQSCNLDVIEGSRVLSSVSLCDFNLPSLGSGELGGCGGSAKKFFILQPGANYTLTAPEIGQEQGEVQLIAVKVKYDKKHPETERYLTWEYKGQVYPINTLMVLTGRTQPSIPWQGWDLSYYSNNPPFPGFSPNIFPPVSSPDFTFGGILFNNPNETYPVEVEILIMN